MNGRIDAAEIDLLLSGDRRELDRYLLTTAIETRDAVESMPAVVTKIVANEIAACRAAREAATAAAVEHAADAAAVSVRGDKRRKLITWGLTALGSLVVIANTVLGMVLLMTR